MRTQALIHFVVYAPLLFSRSTQADPFDHWTSAATGLPANVTSIAYGHGRYVAVGYTGPEAGWILSSSDLANWTSAICADHLCAPPALYGLTFANGLFIAVGNHGWTYVSTNGANWRLETLPSSESSLVDVTHGGGTFAAVGDTELCPCGWVATSQNSTNWNLVDIADIRYLRGIAYGEGRFVAVGLSAAGAGYTRRNIFTSTNSFTNWQSAATVQTNDLFAVAYGNDVFVTAGEEHYRGTGRIVTSADGQSWGAAAIPTTNALRSLRFVEGFFFAAGKSGVLLTSTNGVDWQLRTAFTSGPLGQSILGRGRVLTVAGQNALFASDPLLSLQLVFGTKPDLIVTGLEGRSYRIEATENVGNSVWDNFGTYVLYTSPTIWGDGTPLPNARFYRAVLLP
jgi:hypothetical protein